MQVQSRIYLEEAMELSPAEIELRESMNLWLPKKIIDMHSHANGQEAVIGLSNYALKQVRSSFPDFSLEDSFKVLSTFYPNVSVQYIRFANPYKGIDHRKANEYLLENTTSLDRVILCGIPDDEDYTIGEIFSKRYVGIKLYPWYFEPPAEKLEQFLPSPILDAAQANKLPLILHLPKKLSLCLDAVINLAEKYGNLPIVLAHLGTHRQASGESQVAFENCSKYPNLFMDTSTITDTEVYIQAFETFGYERVLFGSDEPMNVLRFVLFQHPQYGLRFMSRTKYHWLDTNLYEEFSHLAINAIHLHWQALGALRQAIEVVYSNNGDSVKEWIFYRNSRNLFFNP